MNLMNRINNTELTSGQTAICWLAQAGFLIKLSNSTTVVIDPYLSDCVEREFGFKRLSASVVRAADLKADILIITHEHLDHFDVESMPELSMNTKERIICSPSVAAISEETNIDLSKLEVLECGQEFHTEGVSIRAIYADHGDLAPDSIGVLIEANGFSIYYSSDTAYKPIEIAESLGCNPDLAILPINGMYGNLNGIEAAALVEFINAGKVIPCHFWMFREHNGKCGDPSSFEAAMQSKYINERVLFLTPGEIKIIEKEV